MIAAEANAMIVSPAYDWVSKTLKTCEMYLVWKKQMTRLLIYFTCETKLDLWTWYRRWVYASESEMSEVKLLTLRWTPALSSW